MEILEYFQGRQAFRRLGFIDFAYKDLLGSTNAALLLTQIEYWYVKHGGNFYKFRSPCEHKLYKKGDSWSEELHLSEKELRNAITKLKDLELVTTKTTIDRVTTWTFNAEKVFEYLKEYEQKQHLGKSHNSIYEKDETETIKKPKGQLLKSQKGDLKMDEKSFCSITENTAKLTSEITTKKPAPDGEAIFETQKPKNPKRFLSEADKPQNINADIWLDFISYKKERGDKYTATGIKALINKLEKADSETAENALSETMANGWQGIFLKSANKNTALSTQSFLNADEIPQGVNELVWRKWCDYKRERNEAYTKTQKEAFFGEINIALQQGIDVSFYISTAIAHGYKTPIFKQNGREMTSAQNNSLDDIAERYADYLESKGLPRNYDPAKENKKDKDFDF